MKRRVLITFIGCSILMFILFPDTVCGGAKIGLTLWFNTVLPALLPFMILSTFMVRRNITGVISRIASPVFTRVFGVSKDGCYPAVIGMLSGYPIGAKTVAQLYQKDMITREEAQYILSFCNNASPMFLLEYIGVECLHTSAPMILLVIIYISAYIGSLFERAKTKARRKSEKKEQGNMHDVKSCSVNTVSNSVSKESLVVTLDESILDSFITITKIGGYIIIFSVFAQIVEEMLPISDIIKYIGIGILEITTGGEIMLKAQMPVAIRNATIIALCAFGGLSGVAQTASVLGGTDLSVVAYIVAKMRQAVIALALGMVWFYFQ